MTTPDLAVCEECGAGPALTLAYENHEPIAVFACDCAYLAAVNGLSAASVPDAWK